MDKVIQLPRYIILHQNNYRSNNIFSKNVFEQMAIMVIGRMN